MFLKNKKGAIKTKTTDTKVTFYNSTCCCQQVLASHPWKEVPVVWWKIGSRKWLCYKRDPISRGAGKDRAIGEALKGDRESPDWDGDADKEATSVMMLTL